MKQVCPHDNDKPEPCLARSLTTIQLLANLDTICDKLQVLGHVEQARALRQQMTSVTSACWDEFELISWITNVITHLYRELPEAQRRLVFCGYHPAQKVILGRSYAPCAEVMHFCESIEPLILRYSGSST